jgi:hypothetical protein
VSPEGARHQKPKQLGLPLDKTNGSVTGCGRCNSNSGSAAPESTRDYANSAYHRASPSVSRQTLAGGGETLPCSSSSVSMPATTNAWEYPDLPANLNLPNRLMRTRMSGGVAGE